ncbi:MAG: hypothetical protein HY735_06595 [Verrucomicrobia bacterium]|nr:hypothetical protein [Verrucomicrobiota bacterium]
MYDPKPQGHVFEVAAPFPAHISRLGHEFPTAPVFFQIHAFWHNLVEAENRSQAGGEIHAARSQFDDEPRSSHGAAGRNDFAGLVGRPRIVGRREMHGIEKQMMRDRG